MSQSQDLRYQAGGSLLQKEQCYSLFADRWRLHGTANNSIGRRIDSHHSRWATVVWHAVHNIFPMSSFIHTPHLRLSPSYIVSHCSFWPAFAMAEIERKASNSPSSGSLDATEHVEKKGSGYVPDDDEADHSKLNAVFEYQLAKLSKEATHERC